LVDSAFRKVRAGLLEGPSPKTSNLKDEIAAPTPIMVLGDAMMDWLAYGDAIQGSRVLLRIVSSSRRTLPQ
jgi:hypothetical protein